MPGEMSEKISTSETTTTVFGSHALRDASRNGPPGSRPRGNLAAAGAKIGSPRAGNPTLRYTSDSVRLLCRKANFPTRGPSTPTEVPKTGSPNRDIRPTRGCGLHAPAQISHQRASESKG